MTLRPPARPRRSPVIGVSRPSLAASAKLMMLPLRRDMLEIDAAQRLAVETGDRAEAHVDIDVLELGVLALLPVPGPAIDDLMKPRPS